MTTGEKIKYLRVKKNMSQEELGKALGVQKSAIHKYESGLVVNLKRSTIAKLAEVLGTTPAYLMGWEEDPDQIPYEKYGLLPIEKRKIPLLGEIACGEPIFANQEYESYVEVGAAVRADFALRCKGNSMTGARIYDGDIVFVRSQPDVEDGQIAAVIIEDTVTLKRVKRAGNMLILLPENPEFQPIIYQGNELEKVRILGLAVAFQSDVK